MASSIAETWRRAGRGHAAEAVRHACHAMGTRFEAVAHVGETRRLRLVLEAALAVVLELHERWSAFERQSLVSHINRSAHEAPVKVDPETWALLKVAERTWRASGGAFDPTMGRAMRDVRCALPLPTSLAAEVAEGASSPIAWGMHHVVLDERDRSVRFAKEGIALDLGGIAKGAALDAAASVLHEHKIASALLHGGTSTVVAIGVPPEDEGWRVRIGPWEGGPVAILRDCALSVSAQHSARAGHTLDPRTGSSAVLAGCAAVIAPTGTEADAWSTALLVSGELVQGRPEGVCGCIVQPGAAEVRYWAGFERRVRTGAMEGSQHERD